MRFMIGISLAAVAAFLASPAALAQPTDGDHWAAQGRLEDSDAQEAEGYRYDDHRLRLEAGRRYRISASSDDFDTLIRLYRAGETDPVAENDDYDGLNSRINFTPDQTGDYMLRVLSFSPEGRGAYTAEAEALPPLPPPVSTPGSSVNASGTWSLWQGQLAESDPELEGRYYDDYLIHVDAGQRRYISLESPEFDTYVQILPVSGREEGTLIDGDDDAGTGFNSLLGFAPDEPGDYIVRVTSYEPGEGGHYWLWVSQ
jgi:hypothetical protein